jgi:hypothetical protein
MGGSFCKSEDFIDPNDHIHIKNRLTKNLRKFSTTNSETRPLSTTQPSVTTSDLSEHEILSPIERSFEEEEMNYTDNRNETHNPLAGLY